MENVEHESLSETITVTTGIGYVEKCIIPERRWNPNGTTGTE